MTRVMLPRTGTLIGETWLDSTSGGIAEHVNPATGQIQGVVPLAGAAEVDEAVRSAQDAHPSWRRMTPADRRDIILRWTELVRQHLDEHLHLTALESGRPVSQGSAAVDWMAYYAGWADKIDGELIALGAARGINYAVPDPYGVVAVILPFNGPVEIAAMTAVPALVAGNCVVMKPPDVTPYTSALFANLALEAGMPPGVLNVVVGGRQTGESLVAHPAVNKISFTGSPPTARSIMAAASRNLTPLALELGGKSANIVFADADLAAAAAFSAMMALVPCSGQACVLPTRVLVEDAVQDEFMDLVLTTVRSYKVGMPLEPDTVMGPVISEQAMYRILGVLQDAKRAKAGRLVCGGERLGGDLESGWFIEPTIFWDVDNSSTLAQEEIFGPVLSVTTFTSEDEAVRMANDTQYGLGAYLQTSDVSRAHRVAGELQAGYVSVNGFNGLHPGAPFGGTKQSGFGREGGRAGLEEFLRPKNVFINTG
jgi:aldehyde dehydrogenase (NAD+)